VIRTALVLSAVAALAIPVAGLGAARLHHHLAAAVLDRERAVAGARGGVIGKLDRGTVTVFDLTPHDAHVPVVSGADGRVMQVGRNGERYHGHGIRFRIVGGAFRVLVEGRGIDLSVVGRGNVYVEGASADPGLYSLDGADCRRSPATCRPLPQLGERYKLGGPESGEKPSRSKPR
jgi:hypothetical protein